jgi:Ca2+-binding RTX toxin-like protein
MDGGSTGDYLEGFDGNDTLFGGGANDFITGDNGMDRLIGGSGDDRLFAGTGNDLLIGGTGVDLLAGELGADSYRFSDGHTGSTAALADTIEGFSRGEGDVIDLSRVDAATGAGNDAFSFIGDGAFSGTAGELRYERNGLGVMVEADRDGDSMADFYIQVSGPIELVASDFVL